MIFTSDLRFQKIFEVFLGKSHDEIKVEKISNLFSFFSSLTNLLGLFSTPPQAHARLLKLEYTTTMVYSQ
jgi:hypothetical protein